MTIFLGADHRGFNLREHVKKQLVSGGYDFVDMGNTNADPADDFPDFAKAVAAKVSERPAERRGIVICGSGVGADITANKFRGIRSALAASVTQIAAARHDDDVNVLALAADFLDDVTAAAIVEKFLQAPFGGDERFKRRIEKIAQCE